MCLEGASGAGAELLAAMHDADVRTYYVWVPMLGSDDEAAARAAGRRFAEPRATHYWDCDRHLSRRVAKALDIDTRLSAALGDDPAFAWDVYLAYRRGNADLQRPDFWMHQLAVDHAPRLNLGEWRSQVRRLVDEFR
jgi:hypothetical protein